jgi:hypothetical protein
MAHDGVEHEPQHRRGDAAAGEREQQRRGQDGEGSGGQDPYGPRLAGARRQVEAEHHADGAEDAQRVPVVERVAEPSREVLLRRQHVRREAREQRRRGDEREGDRQAPHRERQPCGATAHRGEQQEHHEVEQSAVGLQQRTARGPRPCA